MHCPSLSDIVAGGFCIGCGVCAVKYPSDINIAFDNLGRLQADIASDVRDERDSTICPFSGIGPNETEIAESLYGAESEHDTYVGRYRDLQVGYVADSDFRARGTSGGLASWIATRLLQSGAVDAVAHVARTSDADRLFEYVLSTRAEDVQRGSSSRYYPVEMSKILLHMKKNPGRYLVIGLPCFIKAVRLLELNDEEFRSSQILTLGIVCGHLKSKRFADMLAWEAGIRPGRLSDINFRVKLENEKSSDYGIRTVGDGIDIVRRKRGSWVENWGFGFFKYGACEYCDDVFAETADAVVGDAWLESYEQDTRGNSILVTRAKYMDDLVSAGKADGSLKLDDLSLEDAVKSQTSGIRYRRDGLAYRLYLKEKTKQWHPKKRVEPREDHLSASMKRRLVLRMTIAELSHAAFAEAMDKGKIGHFRKRLSSLVKEHHRLTEPPVRYVINRMKDILRPTYFRFKPVRTVYPIQDRSGPPSGAT